MKITKVKLAQIKRDVNRFQFREEDFKPERVDILVENWDEAQLDPIDLWEESPGVYYLLAGHHRFEAAVRLEIKELPARIHAGEENAARAIALVSNANRLEYTPMEKCNCLIFLLETEKLPIAQAANRILVSADMARKLYSLRHLKGTKWETSLEIQGMLALAFLAGRFCDRTALTRAEINCIYDLVVQNDMYVTQLNQLLGELKKLKEQTPAEPSAANSETLLFNVEDFGEKLVKMAKKRDALAQLGAQTWWLYEMAQRDKDYQVPQSLKEPLLRELRRLYAFCLGSQNPEEIPQRNTTKKIDAIKELKKAS